MWSSSGNKPDHCPCCKVCKNCPGFQKVLDVRDAGFVLYRHTTRVEDIDKKTGIIQVTTDTIDDVFILENTQDVPLEKIDFNPALDRNQISCPRCVNIIKHAQGLLQNQELGAKDLIGVCKHCRQKSPGTCLKCDEVIKNFQLNKCVGKQSGAQRVETWLSKIQGLISHTLDADTDKSQVNRISRRHSDIDLKEVLRKISKTKHEPEIEDLIIQDMRDLYSSMKGPLRDRSFYFRERKEKEVKIQKEDSHNDIIQNESYPIHETSDREEKVFMPIKEKTKDDEILFQSITTLKEDEIDREFIRRYGKSYKEKQHYKEDDYSLAYELHKDKNKVTDFLEDHFSADVIHEKDAKKKHFVPAGTQRDITEDRNFNTSANTRYDYKKDMIPSSDREYAKNKDYLEIDTLQDDTGKKELVPTPIADSHSEFDGKRRKMSLSGADKTRRESILISDKRDESDRKKSYVANTESDHDYKKGKRSVLTSDKYLERTGGNQVDNKKGFLAEKELGHGERSRIVSVPPDGNESDRSKSLIDKTDPIHDDKKRKQTVSVSGKYKETDEKKSFVGKPDSENDYRKENQFLVHGSEAGSKKRFITETESVDVDKKRESQYQNNERRKSIIAKTDSIHDDKNRKDSVTVAGKHHESNRRKSLTAKPDSGHDYKRKESMSDRYFESDRKKVSSKSDVQVTDGRRRKESFPTAGKYYESDRTKESKIVIIPDDRKKSEYIARTSDDKNKDLFSPHSSPNIRRKESVSIGGKYSDKNEDLLGDTIADDRRRKENILTADRTDQKVSTREEDERRKEFMRKTGLRRDDIAKEKKISSTDETQYGDERRKHIIPAKHYENETGQNFISRIGHKFDENIQKTSRDNIFGPKIHETDSLGTDIDNTTGKNIKTLKKYFVPLAVRRYTQDVSALLHPIVDLKERFNNKKKGKRGRKQTFESPSRIRKYQSHESLVTGITKVADGDEGFDYYFPKVEGETKKKPRRAKSEVSSSELIKDTMDKLKLKSEEEKRKREEDERLKAERRKQLEQKRERELAQKIAKDLEKQLKEQAKETEQELKRLAAVKQNEYVDEIKDDKLVKEKTEKETKHLNEQKTKLKTEDTKLIENPVSGKESTKDIGEKAKRVKQVVEEKIKDMKQVVDEKTKGVKHIVEEKAKVVKQIVEDEAKGAKPKKISEEKAKGVKHTQVTEEKPKGAKPTQVSEEKAKEVKPTQVTEEKAKGVKPTQVSEERAKGKKPTDVKEKERETKSMDKDEKHKEETAKKDNGKEVVEETSKDKKNKTEDPVRNKQKPKGELDTAKLEQDNKKNIEMEEKERERMRNELKQQREEEKKMKLTEAEDKEKAKSKEEKSKQEKPKQEKVKEGASQQKEPLSEKEETKSMKTDNAAKNDTTQKKTTGAPNINKIKMKVPSIYDLVQAKDRPKERRNIKNAEATQTILHKRTHAKDRACDACDLSDLELDIQSLLRKKQEELDMKNRVREVVVGETIHKFISLGGESKAKEDKVKSIRPIIFEKHYEQNFDQDADSTVFKAEPKVDTIPKSKVTKGVKETVDPEYSKGVVRYALSDRSFIEKGWTMLPTEKVVRKINVYRMRPAHPEFDWFKRNKNKGLLEYDTGEKLAEFDEGGRGRLYYKSGKLALDYYNAEEVNAQQRFVIYSSGEPDERGRIQPRTVLATFDYLGNGIVFDHAGKIRLKYNQTEGIVLDRNLGPVSHWKWHTLNDPPVLQQVMIDTQVAHKDPYIMKLGSPAENKPRPDDEEMLAIEFDNFIKEKSAKLTQTFKPFQIKMKALKINEYFSLRVLDQATVYLIYRDGSKNIKLNIGMILDHKEIVDTDTAEVGEVSNNLERLPARTDSLAELQRNVANAQKHERSRSDRERRIRRPEPSASADRLTAAASRPLKPPLRTVESASTVAPNPNRSYCKCRKPTTCNVYYDTSLI